ncbi:hypothetical protein GCM10027280_62390 [Micromonospora polyrhachis]|uniref:Uncharacterized protein n=1 Tax=Micromonospora polyrhachis TaxID=1282883 RepID=A0A7W7WS51_9ACTN|nr:hypothetical protein [Micromonospora polyrhachis]
MLIDGCLRRDCVSGGGSRVRNHERGDSQCDEYLPVDVTALLKRDSVTDLLDGKHRGNRDGQLAGQNCIGDSGEASGAASMAPVARAPR